MKKLLQYLIVSNLLFAVIFQSCSHHVNPDYQLALTETAQEVNNNLDLHTADKNLLRQLLNEGYDPIVVDQFGSTPLHYAAQREHIEEIKLLLENGRSVNPNILDKHGRSPLHYAAENAHVEAIQLLLVNNADPNIADLEGNMPLHLAIDNQSRNSVDLLNSVKALLTYKAMVNIPNGIGANPLHLATENNHPAIVALLLKAPHLADASLVNEEDGYTPLHIAAKYGYKQVVEVLLKNLLPFNQLDINAPDTQYGTTPLHVAVLSRRTEIVKYLLQNGADPTITDNDFCSSFHLGAQIGDLVIVELLLESLDKLNLDKKYYLNMLNQDHSAPLHFATIGDNIQLIELLVKNGADIDLADSDGYTPLGIAIRYQKLAAIEFLLQQGANLQRIEYIPYIQPLHCAAKLKNLRLIKVFLEKGANVNTQDQEGHSFLHTMAATKDFGMIKQVIQLIDLERKNLLNILQNSNLDSNMRDILPIIVDYIQNIDWNLTNNQGESIVDILEAYQKTGDKDAAAICKTMKVEQQKLHNRKRQIAAIQECVAKAKKTKHR